MYTRFQPLHMHMKLQLHPILVGDSGPKSQARPWSSQVDDMLAHCGSCISKEPPMHSPWLDPTFLGCGRIPYLMYM
jgi:hypothetical protein